MGDFEEKLNAILSNPEAMAQVAALAQSLGGGGTQQDSQEVGDASQGGRPSPEPMAGPPPPEPGDLSSLLGQIDPGMIRRLLPLVQEMNGPQDAQRRQFLYALRPYLKASRRDKIDRALQIAKMLHLGRQFLGTLGDRHV